MIQTHKRFKTVTLFIRTKHSMRFFLFAPPPPLSPPPPPPLSSYKTTLKQQLNGEKRWKMRWRAIFFSPFCCCCFGWAKSSAWENVGMIMAFFQAVDITKKQKQFFFNGLALSLIFRCFSRFNQVSFSSLIKRITPKIRMPCLSG